MSRAVRFVGVVQIRDDEVATGILTRLIHPIHGQLADAYWSVGSLQDAYVQDWRDWANAEVASMDNMVARRLREELTSLAKYIRDGMDTQGDTSARIWLNLVAAEVERRASGVQKP